MRGKQLDKNITVSGEGLTMWFEAKIAKYSNSPLAEHLAQVYRMMAEEPVFDGDGLKTFFEEEFVGK